MPQAAAGASGGGETALGALTSAHRDDWAAARAELIAASPLNAASLAAIDSALCVLVLDDDAPQGAS
jgi:carnitine O-acetyltransferase